MHEIHRPTRRNPKHAAQFITTLETCAFPFLGKTKVADVTTAGALKKMRASGAGAPTTLAFELLAPTAARSGEVRGATWANIAWEQAEWTIPGTRIKAERVHRVPLPRRAIDLLRYAQALGDGADLEFPGIKQRRPKASFDVTKPPQIFSRHLFLHLLGTQACLCARNPSLENEQCLACPR